MDSLNGVAWIDGVRPGLGMLIGGTPLSADPDQV